MKKRILSYFILLFLFAFNAKGEISPYATVFVNADTNDIIYEKDATKQRYPASLTKMMTIYIAFNYISEGKLKFNDFAIVSKNAAQMPPSKLYLKPKEIITIYDLIASLIVVSANDSAVVLAERIAGSEKRFVKMMNYVAQKLNMKETHFVNPHGLYDDNQYTTARDMARLALALYNHHPNLFSLFSLTDFTYKEKTIKTHNYVLLEYPGAFGLKTGYVDASGYNVASIANRNNVNLLAIVMHVKHRKNRDEFTKKLLDYGFEKIKYDKQKQIEQLIRK